MRSNTWYQNSESLCVIIFRNPSEAESAHEINDSLQFILKNEEFLFSWCMMVRSFVFIIRSSRWFYSKTKEVDDQYIRKPIDYWKMNIDSFDSR